MKKVLLATTALALSAGFASAEGVSWSGSAGAGVGQTASTELEVWSGIDLNVAASTTTDSGIALSISEDFGGGELADYDDDYAIEAQTSDLDTPTLSIGINSTTITLENQAIDDLYDDTQNGDIGIASTIGTVSVGIVLDTDAAAGEAGMSYSLGGAMGGLGLSLVGTDGDDNGDDATSLTASYDAGDISVSVNVDDKGAADDVTEATVGYTTGAMNVSFSADSADDWSATIGYVAGGLSVNYDTGKDEEWSANMSYDLGGGASFKAAVDHAEYMAAGMQFSF
jgi:outer membrane protein OmpU